MAGSFGSTPPMTLPPQISDLGDDIKNVANAVWTALNSGGECPINEETQQPA
jgi:hypothetical protein